MRNTIWGLVLSGAVAITGSAAQAKAPKEQYCGFVRTTEGDKFTYDMQPSWSLYREQEKPGEIRFDDDVVGVTCLRDPVTLTKEDVESLKQGISLYFADAGTGATVTYRFIEGKITYEADEGTFGRRQIKRIEKAIAAAQSQI